MRLLNEYIHFFLLAFLAGIFLAGVFAADVGVVGLFLLLAGVVLFVGLVRRKRLFVVCGIMLFCAAVGVLRFGYWSNTGVQPELARTVGTEAVMRGVIAEEPDVREHKVNLTVRLRTISSEKTPVDALVLVSTDIYPTYVYGEVIELRGTLARPKLFETENGRVFAYDQYLAAKDIRLTLSRPTITRTGDSAANPVKGMLLRIKASFKEQLGKVLPDPSGALAGGILLGDKRSLGDSLTEDFRQSGIIHIVVLSGYNMTIVAEWLRVIFLFTGFWGSIGCAALGVTLFGIMAGGSATVIRAMLMALLVLLARVLGRTYDMSRALLFAGALMVLHAPGILLYDPSFQLSFLAASGLLLFVPILKMHFTRLRAWPKLEEIVLSTVATQLFVTPLLIYGSGGLSLIGLLVNILVLPIIPAAMLFSFVGGLSAFFGTGFGLIAAIPAYVSLSYIIAMGRLFADIPFGYITIPPVSGFVVCVVYALLFMLCVRAYRQGSTFREKSPRG